ncbi:MAG: MotA/TolQ/ExbB proton channel family protein [Burkholderiaceae bacterium]|nr:MotA/TolQ/ExbB proton channel family protein [Burkholderiaceae bacterium]
MDGTALGLGHFWAQADALIRFTAWLLLAMSVGSWFVILWKALGWWRVRRAAHALEAFWQARSVDEALALLKPLDGEQIFVPLAASAAATAQAPTGDDTLSAQMNRSEWLTRALRQRINEAAARLEAGLTFLASVGATAPFVGLFGTVWGIYHALIGIAATGAISIEKVAGPVGEALIMTAFGLAVAIPAVLGYNAFTRVNRLVLAQLDGFAHDLHAYFTVGARPAATD